MHNNDCADLSIKNVKKKKIFKILGAGGLAFFMGVGTLCGVLLAPMNARANISSTTSASNSATSANSVQTSNNGQGLITPQEEDPVLFTTESGLEVKLANSIVSTGRLEGYAYFTMGKYNGKYIGLLLVIIVQLVLISLFLILFQWKHGIMVMGGGSLLDSFYNTSNPAGLAISSEMSKQQVVQTMIIASTTNATSTTEVDPVEFLCLSQDNICNSVFSSASSINMYEYFTCVLKTTIKNMYTTTLGVTEDEQALIDPQIFTTSYHDYSTTTYDAYMFPLASRGEKFDVSNYLSAEKRGASSGYWSRSGWPSKNQYGRVIW